MTLVRLDTVKKPAPKKAKQPRKKQKKFSMDVWRSALLGLLFCACSQRAFCNQAYTEIPRKTLLNHWGKLEALHILKKKQDMSYGEKKRLALPIINEHLNKFFENILIRTKSASKANRYITDEEEKQIVCFCKITAAAGIGLSKEDVHDIINDIIKLDEVDHDEISMDVVEKIIQRNKSDMKAILGASLDPKRAEQATEETRQAFFAKLNAWIKLLYANGEIPWSDIRDIPKECWYNMDEVANDNTKHRQKVLGGRGNPRTFQITVEGDGKMSRHITLCITTRADGLFADKEEGIDGAPAEMIIHTEKGHDSEEERDRQRRGETPRPDSTKDQYKIGIDLPGVKVVTSKTGSSTQETFYHYCQHFVSSIPPASERQPVILLLDGHASRWNTQALRYLMQNNVFPFFLPSHTSIWSQPNDAGTNIGIHSAIEEEVKVVRRKMAMAKKSPDLKYYNTILNNALKRFHEKEREDLRTPQGSHE